PRVPTCWHARLRRPRCGRPVEAVQRGPVSKGAGARPPAPGEPESGAPKDFSRRFVGGGAAAGAETGAHRRKGRRQSPYYSDRQARLRRGAGRLHRVAEREEELPEAANNLEHRGTAQSEALRAHSSLLYR